MSDIDTWFQQAAGFSAASASELIRSTAMFLAVVLMTIIAAGVYAKVSSGEDTPMHFVMKLIFLSIWVTLMWSILY